MEFRHCPDSVYFYQWGKTGYDDVIISCFSFFLYDVVILTIPLIRHVVCPEYNLEELEKEIPGIKEATTVGSKSFRILPIKLLLCKYDGPVCLLFVYVYLENGMTRVLLKDVHF